MLILQHKKIVTYLTILFVIPLALAVLFPQVTHSMGLKITPLKYEETLEVGEEKTGYVDVANPNDQTITVSSEVQAFRQINSRGDLEFYGSERYKEAIQIDVEEFELEPREAARVRFDIDSSALPEGGVYAALFFETTAQETSEDISSIGTSARVGTLLILQNGEGVKSGRIDDLNLSFWQLGDGIEGSLAYHNSDEEKAIGFNPELKTQVTPWGGVTDMESGLVLPGVTRELAVNQPGDYLGLIPVTVIDDTTGSEKNTWVFAVTGLWRLILPVFLLTLLGSLILQRYFKKH